VVKDPHTIVDVLSARSLRSPRTPAYIFLADGHGRVRGAVGPTPTPASKRSGLSRHGFRLGVSAPGSRVRVWR